MGLSNRHEANIKLDLEYSLCALLASQRHDSERLTTLRISRKVAGIMYEQGRMDRALSWYCRVLEGYLRYDELGGNHVEALSLVQNILDILYIQ